MIINGFGGDKPLPTEDAAWTTITSASFSWSGSALPNTDYLGTAGSFNWNQLKPYNFLRMTMLNYTVSGKWYYNSSNIGYLYVYGGFVSVNNAAPNEAYYLWGVQYSVTNTTTANAKNISDSYNGKYEYWVPFTKYMNPITKQLIGIRWMSTSSNVIGVGSSTNNIYYINVVLQSVSGSPSLVSGTTASISGTLVLQGC